VTAPAREFIAEDEARIASRQHPLGAVLPVLDYIPPPRGFGIPLADGETTHLGVTTVWNRFPVPSPDDLLNLYSWSKWDSLTVEGLKFVPGSSCLWHDQKRIRSGSKPWKVTLVSVATEHVGRLLHLPPALMVRTYNGTLHFALPQEIEL
jgi:hypothetical protein